MTTNKKEFNNLVLPRNTKVANYLIEEKIASGGFGVVYRAINKNGQSVALKEFLPQMINCRTNLNDGITFLNQIDKKRFQEGLASFFREAETLSKLHIDKIIPILDVFEANSTAYLVMPMEKGSTLHAWVRKNKLTQTEYLDIFFKASLGVDDLHSNGLLHLDLKPSNIWIRPDKNVFILDLGASRWEDEEVKKASLARTPGYAAPEQHNNRNIKTLTVKTDVYGFCATIFSSLMRFSPMIASERKLVDISFSKLFLNKLPQSILSIIDTGMSLNPKNRFNNLKEIQKEIVKIKKTNEILPFSYKANFSANKCFWLS